MDNEQNFLKNTAILWEPSQNLAKDLRGFKFLGYGHIWFLLWSLLLDRGA